MIIDFKSGKQTERMRLKRDERRDGMDDEERGSEVGRRRSTRKEGAGEAAITNITKLVRADMLIKLTFGRSD